MKKRTYYIDDTDVSIDNRDPSTTCLLYEDEPHIEFVIDTRFALELVRNALENKYAGEYTADRVLHLCEELEKFLNA